MLFVHCRAGQEIRLIRGDRGFNGLLPIETRVERHARQPLLEGHRILCGGYRRATHCEIQPETCDQRHHAENQPRQKGLQHVLSPHIHHVDWPPSAVMSHPAGKTGGPAMRFSATQAFSRKVTSPIEAASRTLVMPLSIFSSAPATPRSATI